MSVDTSLLDSILQKHVSNVTKPPAAVKSSSSAPVQITSVLADSFAPTAGISQQKPEQDNTETGPETVLSLQAAGLIVKAENGSTLYSNAFGKLNFEDEAPPFTTDSVCWIASMTKLVTSVSALQLVEKGLIGLDDDVGQVIPELSKKEVLKGFQEDGTPILTSATKPLTLRNLLSHSSGFCYDAIDEKLQKWAAFVGREINAQSRTLDGIRYPLIFEPGESWQYGVGIDWAGQVIEALTNQTLGKYMQRNVFDPLGMSSTTFRISDRPDLAQRRAALGFRSSRDSPLGPGPDPAPINPEIEMGGGGIFTSANDYGKLLGALISGDERILKLETVKELMTPQLKDPKPLQEYCDSPMHEMITPEFPKGLPVNATLGGAVNLEDVPGKRRKGSMMWSGLTNPRWWIDPEMGIAATMFVQALPMGDPVAIRLIDELERAIYQTIQKA